jgi:hypothetical protein
VGSSKKAAEPDELMPVKPPFYCAVKANELCSPSERLAFHSALPLLDNHFGGS